jgi:hypothetical protein
MGSFILPVSIHQGVFSNPVCHRKARSAPGRSSSIASSWRNAASRKDWFENTS